MFTYEQQQVALAAENFEKLKAKFLADVYHANPTYAPNMANDKQILGVVEEVYGTTVVPNLALFESAIELNPDRKFVRRTVAYQVDQLVDQIIDLLQATRNPYWSVEAAIARVKLEIAEQVASGANVPTNDSLATRLADAKAIVHHNINNEKSKLLFQPPEKLRARLTEIRDGQMLQKSTGAQLQEQLKQHRVSQQPAGRVILPPEYTAQRLKDRNFPVSEFKKLIRTWGADACNDRLNGRS
jgi:hypothetical protein